MNGYSLMADTVLMLHALFVVFVVLGLLLIMTGAWRGWVWVRNPWFRAAHLGAIGVVVLQSWLGVLCPLTGLEDSLRARAGQPGYAGSFIAYWLHRLLFYQAPDWAFIALYSLFGALVALMWIICRPHNASR